MRRGCDFLSASADPIYWTADGQVKGVAAPMRAAIWKFTPEER
jgi:hypothetical protein